jgi:hypothetical protein
MEQTTTEQHKALENFVKEMEQDSPMNEEQKKAISDLRMSLDEYAKWKQEFEKSTYGKFVMEFGVKTTKRVTEILEMKEKDELKFERTSYLTVKKIKDVYLVEINYGTSQIVIGISKDPNEVSLLVSKWQECEHSFEYNEDLQKRKNELTNPMSAE